MAQSDGVSLSASPTWAERPRAPLWELIKGVIWGELLGGFFGTCVLALLWLPHLTTFRGHANELYWPWPVDGAWALAGDLGWAILVVTPIAWLVRFSVAGRTDGRLSFMWTWISVAAAGYTALALPASAGGRVVIAVLGAAVLLRLLGFGFSGTARPWPRRMQLPLLGAGTISLALFVAVSFSLLHPFVVTGGGGSTETFVNSTTRRIEVVRPGRTVFEDIGFSLGGLPARVTEVRPLGTDSGVVASAAVAADIDDLPLDQAPPLPVSVPYGHELWARFYVTLTACAEHPTTAVTALRVNYETLGFIGLSQTVNLEQPIALTCARH